MLQTKSKEREREDECLTQFMMGERCEGRGGDRKQREGEVVESKKREKLRER